MKRQKFLSLFLSFFLVSILAGYVQGSHHHHHRHHHSSHRGKYGFHPTKLFVFGDSYADTGNNGKLASSWHVPYGTTFPGKPAGRFSDGRVLTDYLAKYLGLKSPIPYRWRKYAPTRIRYGVNFASGGTGVFETLFEGPNMTTQIDFFQALIAESIYTRQDLQSSVALVTLAGNDYAAYKVHDGSAQNLPSFITRVVNQLAMDLKRIHGLGVRRIAVAALQPLGCLPRSTVSNSFQQCNATENSAVNFHNLLLQEAVAKLNNESHSSCQTNSFLVLDLYSSFTSVLKNGGDALGNLRFESPMKPCCMGISSDNSCGDVSENGEKMYTVCSNPKSAFFWDMVHPTQAGWGAVYVSLKSTLDEFY